MRLVTIHLLSRLVLVAADRACLGLGALKGIPQNSGYFLIETLFRDHIPRSHSSAEM